MDEHPEILVRFAIGIPILYVLIGGLILRAAVSLQNRFYGCSPPPRCRETHSPEKSFLADTTASKRDSNPFDERGHPVLAADTEDPDYPPIRIPSLPLAFGIVALAMLLHAGLLVSLGSCCTEAAHLAFAWPRGDQFSFIMVTFLSLPVHFLLEAKLCSLIIRAPFRRCCAIVAFQAALSLAALFGLAVLTAITFCVGIRLL